MKNVFKFLMVAPLLVACADEGSDKSASQEGDYDSPELVWQEIQGWETWELAPGVDGISPSTTGAGVFYESRVNPTLAQFFEGGELYPADGSIVVRPTYNEAQTLTGITVMRVQHGVDRELADWSWWKFSPDGEVEVHASNGRDYCSSCHLAYPGQAYLISPQW